MMIGITAANADQIAGLDFEDGAGGSDTVPDDLNAGDGISVSGIGTIGGGFFNCCDGGAQNGRASFIGRANGPSNIALPAVGAPAPADGAFFSITIPAGVSFNLENVSWESSQATGGNNTRWLAFKTSLDTGLLHSAVGVFRPGFDNISLALTDSKYKNLTDTTVDFQWYPSGTGTGDSDIDNIIIEGSFIPEPSTFLLAALGLLGLLGFTRRRRK